MLSFWLHTPTPQAHIERALHNHFLFKKLTDSEYQVLLDWMQRVEVMRGQIVVELSSFLSLSPFFFPCHESQLPSLNQMHTCKWEFKGNYFYMVDLPERMKMPIICYVHRLLVCRMAKVTVFMWLAVEILRSWQPRFISFFLLLIHYISSSRHFLETLCSLNYHHNCRKKVMERFLGFCNTIRLRSSLPSGNWLWCGFSLVNCSSVFYDI